MDIQIDYFNITRKQIDKLLGASKAREHINKRSIFSITVGSNDFLNNYLLPVISAGARITQTPDSFVDDLINHLRGQLTVCVRSNSLVQYCTIIDPKLQGKKSRNFKNLVDDTMRTAT